MENKEKKKMEMMSEWVNSFKSTIVDFKQGGWVLVRENKNNPPKYGIYHTLRVGLNGVYTVLDRYIEHNGKAQWELGILDDSRIIAYKPTEIEIPKSFE